MGDVHFEVDDAHCKVDGDQGKVEGDYFNVKVDYFKVGSFQNGPKHESPSKLSDRTNDR